jgi:hypothetical protein
VPATGTFTTSCTIASVNSAARRSYRRTLRSLESGMYVRMKLLMRSTL